MGLFGFERSTFGVNFEKLGIPKGGKQEIKIKGFFGYRDRDNEGNAVFEYFNEKTNSQLEIVKDNYLNELKVKNIKPVITVMAYIVAANGVIGEFKKQVCGKCPLARRNECGGVEFKANEIGMGGHPYAMVSKLQNENDGQMLKRLNETRC
jgi:hypothetical protein